MSSGRGSNNNAAQKLTERAFSESKLRYRSFFDNSSEALFLTNENGHILAANPAAERMFGMTEAELIAAGRDRIVVKDERVERALQERAEKGTATFELTLRRKDGSTFPGEITSTLFKDADGSTSATIAIRDVTDRKNMEERSCLLHDTMVSGVVFQDAEGRIISMNPSAERILGKEPVDFIGSSSVSQERYCIREDGSPFPGNDHPAIVALRTGQKIEDVVMGVFNLRDMDYRWINIAAIPLFRSGETRPYQVYTIFEDITERRRTEEALRKSEESLCSHIESSPLAVVEWDKDFIVTRWAGEAEHMFGYTAKEAVGKPIMDLDLILPGDVPIVERTMGKLTDGLSKRVVSSNRNVSKDGKVLYCTWYNTVLYDAQGKMSSVLSFVLDNTARVDAENALRWRQARDELLAGIAGKLLSTADTQSIIENLAIRTMQFLNCDVFFNYIVDKQRGGLTLNAYSGVPSEEMADMKHLEYGHAVCGRVAQGGKRIVVNDILTSDDVRTPFQRSQGVQAYACNPLMADDKVIGTLSFGTKSRPKFSDDELEIMQEVAGYISLAMQRMMEQDALKASEKLARRQAEEMRAIMDAVPATIWISQNPEGTKMVGNKATEDLLSVGPGANVSETAPLEERSPHFLAYCNGEVISPEDLPMQKAGMTGKPALGVEFEIRFEDGRSVWLYGNTVPLLDDEGKSRGAVGAFVDITDRKNTEEALKASEATLDAFFNASPGILNIEDEKFRYVKTDRITPTYFDLDQNSIIGKAVAELAPQFIERYGQMMRSVIETGEPNTVETFSPVPGRQGQIAYWRSTYFPIPLPGGKRGIGIVGVEITDLKNAQWQIEEYSEKLEKSNTELQQFAYVASHDLREPLRMVTSYLGLLTKKFGDELNAQAKEYVSFAVDGSMRMKELIDDLLQYSRIDSQPIELDEVDMNEVVKVVEQDLHIAIRESGAELVISSLPTIHGDETQIKQVLTNLISNAIKFHGDKTPKIEVSAISYDGEAVFSVRDNGIGIDPKYSDKLFKMFSRLHTRDEYPGTGIGLAICKKIVERHGGRIWLESEIGKGTTFFFTLPV